MIMSLSQVQDTDNDKDYFIDVNPDTEDTTDKIDINRKQMFVDEMSSRMQQPEAANGNNGQEMDIYMDIS